MSVRYPAATSTTDSPPVAGESEVRRHLFGRLDLWQMSLILVLICFSAVSTNVPALSSAAVYLRFPAAAALLFFSFSIKSLGTRGRYTQLYLFGLWSCVATAAISTIWSLTPLNTALYAALFGVLACTLTAVSVRRWNDPTVLRSDLVVIYWTMAGITLVGFLAFLGGLGFATGYLGRATGFFENANKFGAVSAIAAILGWALIRQGRDRWILYITFPLAIATLASESRTAILGLLVASVWLVLRSNFWAKFVTLWTASVAGLTLLAVHSFDPLRSPFAAGGLFSRLLERGDEESLNNRLPVWQLSIDVAVDTKTGIGFGGTRNFLNSDPEASLLRPGSVHNSYLQWFLETGFGGLITMSLLLLVVMFACLRTTSPISIRLAALALAGFAFQFTESVVFGLGQSYPWIYWLIVLALARTLDGGSDSSINTAK